MTITKALPYLKNIAKSLNQDLTCRNANYIIKLYKYKIKPLKFLK